MVSGDDSKGITIHVDQKVTTQAGGQIIGAYFAAPETKPPSPEAIVSYLNGVLKGVGPPQDDEVLQRLWNLPFCARPYSSTGARQDLDQVVRKRFERAKGEPLLQRVVILADAGAGKTPSLQFLMVKTAERSLRNYQAFQPHAKDEMEWPRTAVVPLFIALAKLCAGLPFLTLVRAAFNRYATREITLGEADRLLQERECLLLLDGLDELNHSEHRGAIQSIRQFMDTYPHERYAISCRSASYHEQLGPMDAFVLADLSDDEVKTVLGDLYSEVNAPLRQLARNRAVLDMILGLERTPEMPRSKGQLLQRLIRQDLGVEAPGKIGLEIDPEMAEGLLERLAHSMQCVRTYHYSERQLMRVIIAHLEEWHEPQPWRQVAQALRKSGVLVRDERRQWRFRDRSTQAYFTASATIQDPDLFSSCLEQASDLWWRETLEILVGLVSEPSDLLFDMIDRDVLVAAHCLPFVGGSIDQSVADALIDALIERMPQERAVGREQVVRLLSQTGHPRAKEAFWQLLRREWRSLVIVAVGRALWRLAHAESPTPRGEIDAALASDDLDRREEAVIDLWCAHSEMDESGKAEIEERLITLMNDPIDGQDRLVNGLSAVALGFIGTERARGALLAKMVEPRVDDFVAWCVVDTLSQVVHPEVEQAALDLFRGEEYQGRNWRRHHGRAIYLLGWGGRLPQTVQAVFQALDDTKPSIRGWAAHALGRLEPQGARRLLEQKLEVGRENDPWVLRKIADALGKIGTLDSIPSLERYLRHEQLKTRRRMREAIADIRQRYELA